jgi:hypothetical protein
MLIWFTGLFELHPPGCTVSRAVGCKPYIHENFMTTWRQMEDSLTLAWRAISAPQYIDQTRTASRDARIKPALNEMELHPTFSSRSSRVRPLHGIQPVDIVRSGRRPVRTTARRRTRSISKIPLLFTSHSGFGVHPAVVCIKWAIQRANSHSTVGEPSAMPGEFARRRTGP